MNKSIDRLTTADKIELMHAIVHVENIAEERWHESGRRGSGQSLYTFAVYGGKIWMDNDCDWTFDEWFDTGPVIARLWEKIPTEIIKAMSMMAEECTATGDWPETDSDLAVDLYRTLYRIL